MLMRKDYMENASELHRQYYGQFVTPGIKQMVLERIGLVKLLRSTDPHFNDIPLERWDAMHQGVPDSVFRAVRDSGDVNAKTLGVSVCILKEAARQIVESIQNAALPDWEEITESRYDELLGCVPPRTMFLGGFLVGEPWSHRDCTATGEPDAPTYQMCVQKKGKHFASKAGVTFAECLRLRTEPEKINIAA